MSPVLAIARLVIKEIFRKKDFYVAFVLVGVLLLYAQNLQFYNVRNVSRYMAEIGLALIYLFSVILCSALAARQYPSEVQNRTVSLLLAKPVSRAQFVAGKFAGVFAASTAAFTLFFGVFIGAIWWKAGSVNWPVAGQTFFLFVLNLAVLSAMTSAFSYLLTAAANVTLSLVFYHLMSLYGAGLRESARGLSEPARSICEVLYFTFPHFEFFDLRQRFVHGWEGISPDLLGLLTLYASAYVLFFLLVGFLIFRRRPL